MKKIILFILLIILNQAFLINKSDAQWSLKSNTDDGKYSLISNTGSYFGISAGGILSDAVLMLTPSDTAGWRLVANTENGLYSLAENKTVFMGIDSGKIRTKAIYVLNPSTLLSLGLDTNNLAYINKSNSFIGKKQTFDTLNASVKYLLNGTSINTAGTLTNVAYQNQSNTFSGNIIQSAPSLTGSNSSSALNISQVWNTSGTPTALKLNITDSASNSASILMDLQVNASSVFKVDKTGGITIAQNLYSNNIQARNTSASTTWNLGTGSLIGLNLRPISNVSITSGTSEVLDVNGTFAAATGSASFRPLNIIYTINNSGVQSGTTTGIFLNAIETSLNSMNHNLLDLQLNSNSVFSVRRDGKLTASIILSGSDVVAGPNNSISFSGRGGFGSSSTTTVYAYANSGLTMFGLGGYSASVPGLGISGTIIQAKLADGSSYTDLEAANVKVNSNLLPLVLNTSSLGSSSLYLKSTYSNNSSTRDTTLTGSATVTSTFPEKILVDAAGGNITITFPNNATLRNFNYKIKRIDNTGNTVTLSTAGTIDDAATKSVLYNSAYTVSCTGSGVYKIF